ncbi:MAG: hypothetical protein JW827_00415 [Spirochaetes bacterium]|nr:hypothetical protein [Spirochaetota bacterium]
MKKLILNIVFIIILIFPFHLQSAGLKAKLAKVLIENLQPGKTYDLTSQAHLPFEVQNTSKTKAMVTITPSVPERKIEKGFEPIPDLSWVKLSKSNFELTPGESAISDIIITVPDDEKYLGKKYQLDINSVGNSVSKNLLTFNVELVSRILFTVAPVKKATDDKVNLNFNVSPLTMEVKDVKTGTKIALGDLGYKLILENLNEESFEFEIKSLNPARTLIRIPEGFQPVADPDILSFSETRVKLDQKEKKYIHLFLDIPDTEEYKGKDLIFVIAVNVKNQGVHGTQYVKLLVSTGQ